MKPVQEQLEEVGMSVGGRTNIADKGFPPEYVDEKIRWWKYENERRNGKLSLGFLYTAIMEDYRVNEGFKKMETKGEKECDERGKPLHTWEWGDEAYITMPAEKRLDRCRAARARLETLSINPDLATMRQLTMALGMALRGDRARAMLLKDMEAVREKIRKEKP